MTLFLLLALAQGGSPDAVLSPTQWPDDVRERYLRGDLSELRSARDPSSKEGLVIGTSSPYSIHAGAETLRRGGNALDAILAASMAQIVHAAGSINSFAGIMNLVYFEASSGKVYTMNAGYQTVAGEDDPLTIPQNPTPSGRPALVPGFFAGVDSAHEKFGRLPFHRIFEPAIYLAAHGFPLDRRVASMIESRRSVLERREETKTIFTDESGEWIEEGELFRQTALAHTLTRVSKEGADYIYRGKWAKKMIDAVREEGGKMTLEDLDRYRVQWAEPSTARLGESIVHTLPPPEFGAVQLIEAIHILDAANLDRMGAYDESDEALYWLMQICRYGHVVTYTPGVYQPSPDLPRGPGQVSAAMRLEKKRGLQNWNRIQAKDEWEEDLHHALKQRLKVHSDTNVVVDREGNMAVVLHSINALIWGFTGIFVDGISIPDSAAVQRHVVAQVGPSARLPNLTNPMIATRDGRAILGASTIGSSLHELMVQSVVDILMLGRTPEQSVRTPKFWGAVWRRNPVGSPRSHPQAVDPSSFEDALLDAVRKRGQPIEVLTPDQRGLRISYWVGIQTDPGSGVSRGASHIGWVESTEN